MLTATGLRQPRFGVLICDPPLVLIAVTRFSAINWANASTSENSGQARPTLSRRTVLVPHCGCAECRIFGALHSANMGGRGCSRDVRPSASVDWGACRSATVFSIVAGLG